MRRAEEGGEGEHAGFFEWALVEKGGGRDVGCWGRERDWMGIVGVGLGPGPEPMLLRGGEWG